MTLTGLFWKSEQAKALLFPFFHAVQKKYNYLPESALRRVCEITDITPASITGVSTFYTQFRHTTCWQTYNSCPVSVPPVM